MATAFFYEVNWSTFLFSTVSSSSDNWCIVVLKQWHKRICLCDLKSHVTKPFLKLSFHWFKWT